MLKRFISNGKILATKAFQQLWEHICVAKLISSYCLPDAATGGEQNSKKKSI